MTDMLTEEEQLIALKMWWKRYGHYLLIGIAIALIIYFAWTLWQNHVYDQRAVASYDYQTVLDDVIDGKIEAAEGEIHQQTSQNLPQPYATMEALSAAALAVDKKDEQHAIVSLKQVIQNSDDNFLKELAKIRLAHIYLAQNEPQQALDLLPESSKHAVDASEWLMTRAAALTALGKLEEARAAYGEIILLYPAYSPQRDIASMYLADIPE